jgi:hypothetical protein
LVIDQEDARAHLPQCVTEAIFQWNTRKNANGVRMVDTIKGAERRRLKHREPSRD